MIEHGFGCHVAGVPQGIDDLVHEKFDEEVLLAMNQSHATSRSRHSKRGSTRGSSGPRPTTNRALGHRSDPRHRDRRDGHDRREGDPARRREEVRRLGSTAVEQVMASGISARDVRASSPSATRSPPTRAPAATGTEAIFEGCPADPATAWPSGCCAAGAEAASQYIWGGFDAMRVLCRARSTTSREKASRPMSASAGRLRARGGRGRAHAREPLVERPGAGRDGSTRRGRGRRR